jgi:hypothetical protein
MSFVYPYVSRSLLTKIDPVAAAAECEVPSHEGNLR